MGLPGEGHLPTLIPILIPQLPGLGRADPSPVPAPQPGCTAVTASWAWKGWQLWMLSIFRKKCSKGGMAQGRRACIREPGPFHIPPLQTPHQPRKQEMPPHFTSETMVQGGKGAAQTQHVNIWPQHLHSGPPQAFPPTLGYHSQCRYEFIGFMFRFSCPSSMPDTQKVPSGCMADGWMDGWRKPITRLSNSSLPGTLKEKTTTTNWHLSPSCQQRLY